MFAQVLSLTASQNARRRDLACRSLYVVLFGCSAAVEVDAGTAGHRAAGGDVSHESGEIGSGAPAEAGASGMHAGAAGAGRTQSIAIRKREVIRGRRRGWRSS